jgi:hypothetical protein
VFVEQLDCFDPECLLLGLEVGEWFFGGPVCQSVPKSHQESLRIS